MQRQLTMARVALAEAEVTGSAGDGLVVVTMRGTGELTEIRIDPSAVDPHEVRALEDLVTTAFRNALGAVRALTDEKMDVVTSGLRGLGDVVAGPRR
jgi:DNA-binding YbaB/EbfC family protein